MKDSRFIEAAMDAHQDTVFRVACNILNSSSLAEDVVQETFIKLFQCDKEFDDEGHLRGWLIVVARNLALDRYRRNKASPVEYVDKATPDMLSKLMEDQAQLSESNLGLDSDHYLWRHVAQLTCLERQVVYLRYVEELSVKEVAQIVDRPYPSICSLLFRIRGKLKKMIEQEKAQRKEKFL